MNNALRLRRILHGDGEEADLGEGGFGRTTKRGVGRVRHRVISFLSHCAARSRPRQIGLATLTTATVETLLGEVSDTLSLLAPTDALLQVELLLHGGLGIEALALDVAH